MTIINLWFLDYPQTEDDEIQHFIDAAMAEREKNQAPNALPYKTVKPKPGDIIFTFICQAIKFKLKKSLLYCQ